MIYYLDERLFKILIAKISRYKHHYDDENSDVDDGAIIVNMNGNVLDYDGDDKFIGVNEYSDENEALPYKCFVYSEDDL